jgi:hypothetical protein
MFVKNPVRTTPLWVMYVALRYPTVLLVVVGALAVAFALGGNGIVAAVFAVFGVMVASMNLGALGERTQVVNRLRNPFK